MLIMGYAKAVENQGRYNRDGLGIVESTFCDHAMPYALTLYRSVVFLLGDSYHPPNNLEKLTII